MKYPIKELITITGCSVYGNTEQAITIDTLLTDSRSLRTPESTMFFALTTSHGSGKKYINELYQQGVRAFVTDSLQGINLNDIPDAVMLIGDALKALQNIAAWHRKCHSNIKMVGITGSNGKTIVKEWLFQLISDKQRTIRSPKSYNSQIGVPLSLALIQDDTDLAIIEAGISMPNEMERLQQIILPQTVVITNIGSAHQENFTSLKHKANEKLKLANSADIIVYPKDDETLKDVIIESSMSNKKLFGWSTSDRNAPLYIRKITRHVNPIANSHNDFDCYARNSDDFGSSSGYCTNNSDTQKRYSDDSGSYRDSCGRDSDCCRSNSEESKGYGEGNKGYSEGSRDHCDGGKGYGEEDKSHSQGEWTSIEYILPNGEYGFFQIPFIDSASIQNSITCLATAIALGYNHIEIAKKMSHLEAVAMRLEVKEGQRGLTLINDSYNSDVNSLSIALDFMARRIQKGSQKQVVILSDILQSGEDRKLLYKKVAAMINQQHIDKIITVGREIEPYIAFFNNTNVDLCAKCGYNGNKSGSINDKDEHSNISYENSNLLCEHSSISCENSSFASGHSSPSCEHATILRENSNITGERSNIPSGHNNLLDEHDSVLGEHSNISCQHSRLSEDDSSIIGEHNNTPSGHSSLSCEHFRTTQELINSGVLSSLSDATVLIKGSHIFNFDSITSLLQKRVHETILEVNLNALVDNLNHYRSMMKPHEKIVCMVKASAYGAGSIEVCKTLQEHQVDYLAVAVADEGVALRQAGINSHIMIMNPEMTSFHDLFEYNLEPEVYSFNLLYALIHAANRGGVTGFPVHLKLDTGMHRLGFDPCRDIDTLISLLQNQNAVKPTSIFSHFVGSDGGEFDDFTHQQFKTFDRASLQIQQAFSHKILRHICNSAGIERFPQYHLDMVRLGIGLYGINPYNNAPINTVSTLKTTILQIREVPQDDTVGYSRRGKLIRPSRIAAIPIGYADGLDRHLGRGVGYCVVKGKKAPYVGNICMDVCMIDVTEIDCKEGDIAEIFGENLPVTVLSNLLDTIPYEILTGVSERVKRVYFQ